MLLRLIAVLVLASTSAMAQTSVIPYYKAGSGVTPVTSASPLPISVFDTGNHSGYCYTSNGSGSAASFQVCPGSGSLVSSFSAGTTGLLPSSPTTGAIVLSGVLGSANGGTGVNNGTSTITLAGNLVTSGANSLTFTTTAPTNVTLPTSGTLITSGVTTLSSLTSIGTIGTGTWNGTLIGSTYGGTGVNNGASTITLAGNLITAGANPLTLTTTNTTNITLPTSGTLVSSTVATLSNLVSIGTITTGVWNAGTVTSSGLITSPTFALTGATYSGVTWTTLSPVFAIPAQTLTDTTGTGTIARKAAYTIQAPTFTSTSSQTDTLMDTLYVESPIAGTNNAGANRYAIDTPGSIQASGGIFGLSSVNSNIYSSSGGRLIWSSTAPTITSGFGTSPTLGANCSTGGCDITVGSTPGSAGVIGLTATTNFWNCQADDVTTPSDIKMTAHSNSSVTFTNYNLAGIATNFTAGDDVAIMCLGH